MDATRFVTLDQLAARTRLPRAFLRREANAGRVPSLRAGRRLFFDVDAVVAALTEQTDGRIATPAEVDGREVRVDDGDAA